MCRYQATENGSTYEREKIVGTVRWRMFGRNNVVTGGWMKLHNDAYYAYYQGDQVKEDGMSEACIVMGKCLLDNLETDGSVMVNCVREYEIHTHTV